MKRLIIISMCFLTSLSVYGHSARMAIFEVSQSEGHYSMTITFDIDDLYKSVITTFTEFENAATEKEYHEYISKYLHANF